MATEICGLESFSYISNEFILAFDVLQDEFLDVIYWMRQILGIVLGLIWGFIPLTGIFGLSL